MAALSRQDFEHDSARLAHFRDRMPGLAWTEAQIRQSLTDTLAAAPAGDVWLFAYGSLIWNPCIPVAEERAARIWGLHRAFSIWSRIGRGSQERPGLVLGLEAGGTCNGVALRIERHHAEDELLRVWRREMLTGVYVPTWVRARTAQGPVAAITFASNRASVGWAGRQPEAELADVMQRAAGINGSSAEYLLQTIEALARHGIRDRRLQALVRHCPARAD